MRISGNCHLGIALKFNLPVQSCLGRLTWKSSIDSHFLESLKLFFCLKLNLQPFKVWEYPYCHSYLINTYHKRPIHASLLTPIQITFPYVLTLRITIHQYVLAHLYSSLSEEPQELRWAG